MNRIAVLLPVYKKDNPGFLKNTIQSLLNQSYPSFTIFLGVDGPIEGELNEVVKECEEKDIFYVLRFRENRGLACVLNDLLTASSAIMQFFSRFLIFLPIVKPSIADTTTPAPTADVQAAVFTSVLLIDLASAYADSLALSSSAL